MDFGYHRKVVIIDRFSMLLALLILVLIVLT